mgnify:FL=1
MWIVQARLMNWRHVNGSPMPDLGVVILAGGEGRRIGGLKPDRIFRGERLIDIAIDKARAWSPIVLISVRTVGQVRTAAGEQLLDRQDIEGPLGGLIAALERAQALCLSHVVTLPCDMPLVPADMAERLFDTSRREARAAVAGSGGRLHPVCAVWPVACLADILEYASAGRRSLAGALEVCQAVEVWWTGSEGDACENINTLSDLRRLSE